jgi:hypothetical protein
MARKNCCGALVVLLLVLAGSAHAIMRILATTDRELIDLASFTLRQAVIPAFQRSELLEPLETQYHQHHARVYGINDTDPSSYFYKISTHTIALDVFGHKYAQSDPSRVYAIIGVADALLSIEDGKGKPYTVEELSAIYWAQQAFFMATAIQMDPRITFVAEDTDTNYYRDVFLNLGMNIADGRYVRMRGRS